MIVIFDDINKEDLGKRVEEFFRSLKEKEKRKNDIVKNKSEDIMSRIYTTLINDGHIHDEDVLYFPEKYSITSEEYHALFESMFYYADEEYLYTDYNNPFMNRSVYYYYSGEFIRLFEMSGQGIATTISIVSENELKREGIKNIIEFDEFIESVKKQQLN